MDLPNIFRKFFGIDHFPDMNRYGDEEDRSFFGPPDDEGTNDIQDNFFFAVPNFFQQQINDLLQQFAFQDPQFYVMDSHQSEGAYPSPRSSLLKPGFQDTCQAKPNTDNDLDEKITPESITKLLDKDQHEGHIPRRRPEISVFRRSYITRTVRQPDGTYVTEKISRDEHGNEEKTVTYHTENEDSPEVHKSKGPFGFFF